MSTWQSRRLARRRALAAVAQFRRTAGGSEVSLVVIHNISLPPDEFGGNWVEDFFLNRLDPAAHPYFATIADVQVSAHFYVRRDGRVIQFVGCDQRAWHAGQSCWCERDNCNDYSDWHRAGRLGCPAVHGRAEQYAALWRCSTPAGALSGRRHRWHSHVAPGRKTDPGPHFDWAAVAARHADLAFTGRNNGVSARRPRPGAARRSWQRRSGCVFRRIAAKSRPGVAATPAFSSRSRASVKLSLARSNNRNRGKRHLPGGP